MRNAGLIVAAVLIAVGMGLFSIPAGLICAGLLAGAFVLLSE